MFDKFRKDDDPERRRTFCNICGIRTIHSKLAGYVGTWSDEVNQIDGGQSYAVFQCGGCDGVCFITAAWDSEDYDVDYDGDIYHPRREKQYPPPLEKGFTFDKSHTPGELDNLLEELVGGYMQGHYVSATLLTRVTIEYLVKDADCKGRNLEKKIDDLHAKDLVDKDQHELLQEIRKRGNKSAHEVVALSSQALQSGFEIISLLIDQLYNRPGRAAAAVSKAKRHFKPDEGIQPT